MLFLAILALLAIVAFGVGFTIHWLFIVAIVLALLWVIGLFAGGNFLTGVGSVLGIIGGLLAITYRTAPRSVPA